MALPSAKPRYCGRLKVGITTLTRGCGSALSIDVPDASEGALSTPKRPGACRSHSCQLSCLRFTLTLASRLILGSGRSGSRIVRRRVIFRLDAFETERIIDRVSLDPSEDPAEDSVALKVVFRPYASPASELASPGRLFHQPPDRCRRGHTVFGRHDNAALRHDRGDFRSGLTGRDHG